MRGQSSSVETAGQTPLFGGAPGRILANAASPIGRVSTRERHVRTSAILNNCYRLSKDPGSVVPFSNEFVGDCRKGLSGIAVMAECMRD
jgi:hypothetical protein